MPELWPSIGTTLVVSGSAVKKATKNLCSHSSHYNKPKGWSHNTVMSIVYCREHNKTMFSKPFQRNMKRLRASQGLGLHQKSTVSNFRDNLPLQESATLLVPYAYAWALVPLPMFYPELHSGKGVTNAAIIAIQAVERMEWRVVSYQCSAALLSAQVSFGANGHWMASIVLNTYS